MTRPSNLPSTAAERARVGAEWLDEFTLQPAVRATAQWLLDHADEHFELVVTMADLGEAHGVLPERARERLYQLRRAAVLTHRSMSTTRQPMRYHVRLRHPLAPGEIWRQGVEQRLRERVKLAIERAPQRQAEGERLAEALVNGTLTADDVELIRPSRSRPNAGGIMF